MKDYNYLITELVNYGVDRGLTDELDRTYTINKLVEALGLDEYVKPDEQIVPRKLHLILEDFIALQGDLTGVQKDLFETSLTSCARFPQRMPQTGTTPSAATQTT